MPIVPLLAYSLASSLTQGSTGYFSCKPLFEASLQDALALLETRPLDAFLHQYLLNLLADLSPVRIKEAIVHCDSPVLQTLLAELQTDKQSDNFTAEPGTTPYPRLHVERNADKEKLAKALTANIENHYPLPREILRRFPFISNPECVKADIAKERQQLLAENPPAKTTRPAKETWAEACALLKKAGLLIFPEMRHEASLSPIALLRRWPLRFQVRQDRLRHNVSGEAIAYGRGLSLAQARASCIMEIVERASAHASIVKNRLQAPHKGELRRYSLKELERKGLSFYAPNPLEQNAPIYWLEGHSGAGQTFFAPAQAVFLFCNLDEPLIYDSNGSTGLGAGNTLAEAKLTALLELIERDSNATAPFQPEHCFIAASRDPLIQSLLDDYTSRRIYPLFQDITAETGIPCYRCFVTGLNGEIAQATAAGLNGLKAALSALTETPWPYSWATPAPFGKPSVRIPGRVRFLEDLPDYSMPSADTSLRLIENCLSRLGYTPFYVDITRMDLKFPVVRALCPGLETNSDFDTANPPSSRLLARCFTAIRPE